jgi:hypothetical protein
MSAVIFSSPRPEAVEVTPDHWHEFLTDPRPGDRSVTSGASMCRTRFTYARSVALAPASGTPSQTTSVNSQTGSPAREHRPMPGGRHQHHHQHPVLP